MRRFLRRIFASPSGRPWNTNKSTQALLHYLKLWYNLPEFYLCRLHCQKSSIPQLRLAICALDHKSPIQDRLMVANGMILIVPGSITWPLLGLLGFQRRRPGHR
jgi:hypothetical protein